MENWIPCLIEINNTEEYHEINGKFPKVKKKLPHFLIYSYENEDVAYIWFKMSFSKRIGYIFEKKSYTFADIEYDGVGNKDDYIDFVEKHASKNFLLHFNKYHER